MQNKLFLSICLISGYSFATVSNGFYTGVEAGVSNQTITYTGSNLQGSGAAFSASGLSPVGRLSLGYTSSKYNSFELGSNYNFSSGIPYPGINASLATNAWNLDTSYLLSLPLAISRLAVFGRVGLAYSWVNSTCNCNGFSSISGNSLADILGAGIKYNVSPNLVWRTEWISNSLLFPVGLTSNTGQNVGSWSAEQFQTGFNYYF